MEIFNVQKPPRPREAAGTSLHDAVLSPFFEGLINPLPYGATARHGGRRVHLAMILSGYGQYSHELLESGRPCARLPSLE